MVFPPALLREAIELARDWSGALEAGSKSGAEFCAVAFVAGCAACLVPEVIHRAALGEGALLLVARSASARNPRWRTCKQSSTTRGGEIDSFYYAVGRVLPRGGEKTSSIAG